MQLEPRFIRLRDGHSASLRPVEGADAEGINELNHRLVAAGVGMIRGPSEPPPAAGETLLRIQQWHGRGIGCWLVLDVGGRIAGEAKVEVEPLARLAHRGSLSVGVDPSLQGQGGGWALCTAAMDWSHARGLIRVELGVFASNTRAIRLYERLGFKQEGIRRKFLRYEDGTFDDDVIMAWIRE